MNTRFMRQAEELQHVEREIDELRAQQMKWENKVYNVASSLEECDFEKINHLQVTEVSVEIDKIRKVKEQLQNLNLRQSEEGVEVEQTGSQIV